MIELHTAPTPNGWKISCMLEELALEYDIKLVNLMVNDQKKPDFLALNPNGRIPVIRNTETGEVIFESGAILIYLAEMTQKLMPLSGHKRYEVLQWLMFQMGGVGPMMGQANVFNRYFPEKIPAVIDRYQNEGRRLLSVLDGQLKGREYLCDEFSIADIANWCWARTYEWSGINIDGLDNLKRWIDRMHARPACYRGIQVPARPDADQVIKSGQELIKQ